MAPYAVSVASFAGEAQDDVSASLKTIDFAHHEIHEGDSFSAFYSAASKNDGQKINIYFKTPNTTKYIHVFLQWSASGAAYARIIEGPTVTSNTGTTGVIYNRNRNSSTTSTVWNNATTPVQNAYMTDVTQTGGTIIWQEFAGAAKSEGGKSRNNQEFVLDANTAYVFEMESDAAGLTLNMNIDWYEHTDSA